MARILHVVGTEGKGEGSLFQFPGALILLCMIATSISIISMVLLACGEDPDKCRRRRGNKHSPSVFVGGAACGGGGGGGDGGGGGG
ncbi:hypothetical protein IFM89_014575 [Coptis chinensis]|uniref:Uncharacterized protein n=1 Tax=Coptis chinensis TaxID=261450 RepID=A0A835LEC2_9MAGN|nr:hypothetical protein IFM89_014575 [Coptis chinensis]